MLKKAVSRLWKCKWLAPLSLEDALATFKGTRQKLYARAYDSLLVEPLGKRDSRIKAFVKAEKFNPADKKNPDPRMIQARDPRYNLHLARFLRGIEHFVYGLKHRGRKVIVKCCNPLERAQIILDKFSAFKHGVCLSIDGSRWDKHIALKVLEVEHDFYQSFYPGDHELKQLLHWQSYNRCRTSNGVKYAVSGGRMSGDMNTALGNCLLMTAMVFAAMRRLDIKDFDIVDDGDDCLLMFESELLDKINKELPNIFLEFGQEIKLENHATKYTDIIFCQCKPTWNGHEFTMARDWRKVLSQSCCGTKHWNDPNLVRPMFGLLGDCENALHHGIPILQEYASTLRRLSGGARATMAHMDSSYQYRIANYQLGEIHEIAADEVKAVSRIMFQHTWGVDPSTQLAIEQHLREWQPHESYRDVAPEFCRGTWNQLLDVGIANPTVL